MAMHQSYGRVRAVSRLCAQAALRANVALLRIVLAEVFYSSSGKGWRVRSSRAGTPFRPPSSWAYRPTTRAVTPPLRAKASRLMFATVSSAV